MIAVTCPACNQPRFFPDALAGSWRPCPGCGRSLFLSPQFMEPDPPVVPVLGEPAAPAEALPPASQPERPPPPPLWEPGADERPARPWRQRRPRDDDPSVGETGLSKSSYDRVPEVYYHEACGGTTRVSGEIIRLFTCDPFWPLISTRCGACGRYVSLHAVVWTETGESVAAYRARLRGQMHPFLIVVRVALGPVVVVMLSAALGALLTRSNWPAGLLCGLLLGLLCSYFLVGFLFRVLRNPRDAAR